MCGDRIQRSSFQSGEAHFDNKPVHHIQFDGHPNQVGSTHLFPFLGIPRSSHYVARYGQVQEFISHWNGRLLQSTIRFEWSRLQAINTRLEHRLATDRREIPSVPCAKMNNKLSFPPYLRLVRCKWRNRVTYCTDFVSTPCPGRRYRLDDTVGTATCSGIAKSALVH